MGVGDPDASPIANVALRSRSSKFDLRGRVFSGGDGEPGVLADCEGLLLRCEARDLRNDDSADSASSLEDRGDVDRPA